MWVTTLGLFINVLNILLTQPRPPPWHRLDIFAINQHAGNEKQQDLAQLEVVVGQRRRPTWV